MRNRRLDVPLGQASLRMLLAIHQGQVTRTDRSLQADYLHDGQSCRLPVAILRARELVRMPLSGPPQITADGEKVLRDAGLLGSD